MSKREVESKMRRMLGASPQHRAVMATSLAEQDFWARCRTCRGTLSFKRNAIPTVCPHCGVSLKKDV